MKKNLLLAVGIILLTACGPDIMLSPADYIWMLNNKTERNLVVEGTIHTDIHGVNQDRQAEFELPAKVGNCVLLEINEEQPSFGMEYPEVFFGFITEGGINVIDKESGDIVATWKHGVNTSGERNLFCRNCLSRYKVSQETENKNRVVIEFDITEADLK